jgi:hypothetical protein
VPPLVQRPGPAAAPPAALAEEVAVLVGTRESWVREQRVIYRLNQYGCTIHALKMRWIIFMISFCQADPNGTDQADDAHASSRAPAPTQGHTPYPRWGERGWVGLIYDLDDVCKVANERRLKLEMDTGVSVRSGCVVCMEVRVEGL